MIDEAETERCQHRQNESNWGDRGKFSVFLFWLNTWLSLTWPKAHGAISHFCLDWFVVQTSLMWGPSLRARRPRGITAIPCRTSFWVSEHNTCARFCLNASQRFHCTVCVWKNSYVDSEGCICARTPAHIKKAAMNSLFFPVSDETRKMLSHKCECRDSASGWIHKMPGTLPLPLSLSQALAGRGNPVYVCVCVCVCVCSLSRQPISPQHWVLLQGVQYSQAGRTVKGLYSSPRPDSRQKCSTTSSSGFCAPFVSRHRSRTQNGPGGNPTPRPHVSHRLFGSCSHWEWKKRESVFKKTFAIVTA